MSGLLQPAPAPSVTVPPWEGRSIATQKLRLVEFSAFMESQRDPDTVRRFIVFAVIILLFLFLFFIFSSFLLSGFCFWFMKTV